MSGPEPAETRRRTNTPVKIAQRVYLDPAGRKGPAPKPLVPDDTPLSERARDLWRRWWRSPQATQWHLDTAVPGLSRLLAMYELWWTDGLAPRDQVELRQLEQQYGLSPKGMRELMWVIGGESAESGSGQSTQPTKITDELAARRKRVAAKAVG